jgi:hypothetical protein
MYKSADLLDMFAPANIINQIGVVVSACPVIRERLFALQYLICR